MAELITVADSLLWDRPQYRVSTRARWGDPWTVRPEMRVERLSDTAIPNRSQAQLSRRYGETADAETGYNYVVREPLELDRHYVRIEVEQVGPDPEAQSPGDGSTNILWHGFVEETLDARGGRYQRGSQTIGQGNQLFACLGMESLLAGVPVRHSYVANAAGALYRLERALVFNDPVQNAFGELVPKGNRSAAKGPHGAYLFTDQLDSATYWTTSSIVEYLLTYFGPAYPTMGPLDGNQNLVPFGLTPDSGQAWPQQIVGGGQDVRKLDRPVIACEGRSCFEVLSALLDRRRLLGWTLAGVDSTIQTRGLDTVRLHVFRFNESEIFLSQGFLPPNPRPKALTRLDTAAGKVSVETRKSMATFNNRLVVRGGRNRAVFSVSHLDGTLLRDWSGIDEDAYDAGASGEPNYGTADVYVQEQMNLRARSKDKLSRVYRRFRLPATFDGLVKNGENVGSAPYFFGGPSFYLPSWRMLRRLPMKPPGSTLSDDMPPLVIIRREQADESLVWDLGSRAASQIEFTGHPTGRRWSLTLNACDDGPACEIDVQGAGQHMIARADFVPLAKVEEVPELDFRTELIATIAVEIDQYCEAEYKPAGWQATDALRDLVLDLGPVARRDWIAAGTVTGVENGEPTREAAGRWLRDDQEVVADLAKIAGHWYARPRQACELQISGIFSGLRVGDLLSSVGGLVEEVDGEETLTDATPIGAVVTAVEWNLVDMTTRVTTDYAELDLVGLAEFAGLRVQHSGLRQAAPTAKA